MPRCAPKGSALGVDPHAIKGSSLRLTHVNGSFDFLDTSSQLSIPGYFPPHSFYDTADRTESGDVEFPANLLQIVPTQRPQQINRHIPWLICNTPS